MNHIAVYERLTPNGLHAICAALAKRTSVDPLDWMDMSDTITIGQEQWLVVDAQALVEYARRQSSGRHLHIGLNGSLIGA